MKMKRFASFALVFMVYGLSVYAQSTNKIYIGGTYSDGVTTKPCYWVDGKRVDLPEASNGTIAVENSIVYTTGNYVDVVGRTNKACYWVDGIKHDLDSYFAVSHIAVTNGKVYIGGSSERYPYLWADGKRTGVGHYDSQVRGITISDDIVYTLCSNHYTFYGQTQNLWLSFTSPAPSGLNTSGITVVNGKIYVSGYYQPYPRDGKSYVACYWIDGTRTDFTSPSRNLVVTSGISVANGSIYISGGYANNPNDTTTSVACYWVNSNKIDLADGFKTSGIAVANGNVYVIGYYKQGSVEIPCYWENGVRKALPGGRTVTGIVVDTSNSTSGNSVSYNIGDKGTGGGTVFYANGGRYIECSGELGSHNWDTAVARAQNYNGGGFQDWRLPTQDELNFMYVNLKVRNLGNFSNNWYWSSLQTNDNNYAWGQNFANGDKLYFNKDSSRSFRAVRSF